MFKKTMKFDDLDGNEVEQTFYFNYNKKEVMELLEFGYLIDFQPEDWRDRLPLEKMLEKLGTTMEDSGLSNTENNKMAYKIFQDLLLDAYGQKSTDGVSFEKTWQLRNYWKNHNAFVELIFEFMADDALGAEFIEKCLPPRMVSEAKSNLQTDNQGKLTPATLREMSDEAARRQADPATRIEPGIEAAREALGANPAIEQAAQGVKAMQEDGPSPVAPRGSVAVDDKKQEELTAEDIPLLSEEAFKKLDPRRLDPEAMRAAFLRKTS